MGNYVLLGLQIFALVGCSIGFCTTSSTYLMIIDVIMIPINIVVICGHIHNIIESAIRKYDDEHWLKYHKEKENDTERN